jgi:hypothetical protein
MEAPKFHFSIKLLLRMMLWSSFGIGLIKFFVRILPAVRCRKRWIFLEEMLDFSLEEMNFPRFTQRLR